MFIFLNKEIENNLSNNYQLNYQIVLLIICSKIYNEELRKML